MPKLHYRHYMLGLLTVVGTFNYLDRMVLSLLLESIKKDFHLSDTQLGLLTGIAFTLFYAVAALPIARWADKGNRNTIVTVTTMLWSLMVSLCGAVLNFSQLLLVRVGVAIGEAGCQPPAQSLIADYFDRAERPHAMAIYWLCYPTAVVVGFVGGGWLADQVGWRLTFIFMGIPGVLLALLVRVTLLEPRAQRDEDAVASAASFVDVINEFRNLPTFRRVVMAFSVAYFFGMGIILWLPTFFIRSHSMSIVDVGSWFAFSWGVCGLVGGYLGGFLVARFAPRKESLQMQAVAIIFVISGVLFAFLCLTSKLSSALIFLSLIGVLGAMPSGAVFSAIQSLVDERSRSMAVAVVFLIANLVGLGLGPLAVGFVSDLIAPIFGEDALRYALVLFSPGYLLVAYQYWKISMSIEPSIAEIENLKGGHGSYAEKVVLGITVSSSKT